MGNSSSQTAEVAKGFGDAGGSIGHQWTQSYPRSPHKLLNPHKVLPETITPPRLRPTNNGEILYNGGTISGRQTAGGPMPGSRMVSRSSSSTGGALDASPAGGHVRRESGGRAISQPHLKRYGSVPDLRDNLVGGVTNVAAAAVVVSRSHRPPTGGGRAMARKKYKAPAPPSSPLVAQHADTSQDSWDMTSTGETSDGPTRRLRLFKTRAEMKKKAPGVGVPQSSVRNIHKPTEMQRSRSLPEFQAELQAATSRLRARDHQRQQQILCEEPQPVTHKEHKDQQLTSHQQYHQEQSRPQLQSQPALQSHAQKRATVREPPAEPTRTFYFGMEQVTSIAVVADDNSTSDPDDDYEDGDARRDGIALHLRPILPKKQLEVPRFSPAAAWRQLSAMEVDHVVTKVEHEETLAPTTIGEQRIVVCSRDRWRQQQYTADDSGISGDGDSPTRNVQQQHQNVSIKQNFINTKYFFKNFYD